MTRAAAATKPPEAAEEEPDTNLVLDAITFTRLRETKNKVVYEEELGRQSDPAVVGTLYVSKHAVEALGDPDVLMVQIAAG